MMNKVASQTVIGKYARNSRLAAHPACRGPPTPPPARYHTAKTHNCCRECPQIAAQQLPEALCEII